MSEKSVLTVPADFDLSRLVEDERGYVAVKRGANLLHPVKTIEGRIYFSRAKRGDESPGNMPVFVDFKAP